MYGIAFMGPPAYAMRALGDQISSCIVAQSAAVPTMPWNGSSLTVSFSVSDIEIHEHRSFSFDCLQRNQTLFNWNTIQL
jgi:biotin carboxylase